MEDAFKKILIHVPVQLPLEKLLSATRGTGFVLLQDKRDFYKNKKTYCFARIKKKKINMMEQLLELTENIRSIDESISEDNLKVDLW